MLRPDNSLYALGPSSALLIYQKYLCVAKGLPKPSCTSYSSDGSSLGFAMQIDFDVEGRMLKTDDVHVKCEPRMRSAGPGTQKQQTAFRRCCDPTSASAACFAAASKTAGVDDTLALQAALNCSTKLLTVESRTWLTQPLILTSAGPRRLVLEPGARVEALPGSFHGLSDSLLTVFETDDVTIEATGAVFHMHKEDYISSDYNHSEHRHALHIIGAKGLTVVGLQANNSGGDGCYVTGSSHGAGCTRFSAQGLTLRSVLSTRNYR